MKPNFSIFPNIKTERLFLRTVSEEDAAVIYELRSDEAVIKYIDREKMESLELAFAFIDKIKNEFEQAESLFWIITKPPSQAMIGSICLWNFSEEENKAEVGYELKPVFHNKGIMSEALKAVLKFGFQELQLDSIEAFTHQNNESSKSLLTKHDFKVNPNRKDEANSKNLIFERHRE